MSQAQQPHVLKASAPLFQQRPIIRISKRLYNNLFMERTAEFRNINRLENSLLGFVLVGTIIASGAALIGAASLAPDLTRRLDAALPPLVLGETASLPATLYGGAALAFLVGLSLYGAIGGRLIDFVASWAIDRRKYSRKREGRAELLEKVDHVMRFEPNRILENFDQMNGEGRRVFRKSLVRAIDALRDPADPAAAVVVERFVERKPALLYLADWFRSPRPTDVDDPNFAGKARPEPPRGSFGDYFRQARTLRNGIKLSLLYNALGCELRDETPDGERWRRDYYSQKSEQLTALFDSRDLHLRLRTGTPHLRWPSESNPSSRNEAALYRAFVCVENPVRQPIMVVAIRDVLDMMTKVVKDMQPECAGEDEAARARLKQVVADVIFMLTTTELEMFDKWDLKSLNYDGEAATKRDAVLRIVGEQPTREELMENIDDLHRYDWQLRWDPNYTNWIELAQEKEKNIGRAFAVFLASIKRAGETQAAPVTLRRGDVLVVDNLRCLVSRREVQNVAWIKQVLMFPEEWRFHGYYGFRRSTGAEVRRAD